MHCRSALYCCAIRTPYGTCGMRSCSAQSMCMLAGLRVWLVWCTWSCCFPEAEHGASLVRSPRRGTELDKRSRCFHIGIRPQSICSRSGSSHMPQRRALSRVAKVAPRRCRWTASVFISTLAVITPSPSSHCYEDILAVHVACRRSWVKHIGDVSPLQNYHIEFSCQAFAWAHRARLGRR